MLKMSIQFVYCNSKLLFVVVAFATISCADATFNGTLRVTTIIVPPYMQERSNITNDTVGNDRYEGLIKSLLDHMANFTGIPYSIQLVADGQYGKYDPDSGGATGMIGEVMDDEADLAAAPLIITVDRERAVDFLYAFYSFEAAIVMRERHPSQEPVIRSLEDLANQDVVDYGTATDGAIAKFLEKSTDPLHQKIWSKMTDNPHWFKESNNKGVSRARSDSQFAFLVEGSAADYALRSEPCDLEMHNAGFFKRKYAFAVKNFSPLRDVLNEAMVEIQSQGILNELYDEWFGNECSSRAASPSSVYPMLLAMIPFVTVVSL